MFDAVIRIITRILLAVAGTALAAMMFLTALDVIMRYVFNQPISAVPELVEYLMVGCVSFGIAYCAYHKQHVTVDMFMILLPKRVQAFFNFITNAVAMLFILLTTWQSILYIKKIYSSNLASPVLYIPAYPFVAAVALGFGVFFVILVIHTFEALSEVKK